MRDVGGASEDGGALGTTHTKLKEIAQKWEDWLTSDSYKTFISDWQQRFSTAIEKVSGGG